MNWHLRKYIWLPALFFVFLLHCTTAWAEESKGTNAGHDNETNTQTSQKDEKKSSGKSAPKISKKKPQQNSDKSGKAKSSDKSSKSKSSANAGKSKSSANTGKSKSSGKSKTSGKSRKSSKDKTVAASSHASAKVQFSKEEIEKYRAMPYEVWTSPRTISEIGLPIEPGFAQPYPYGNLMRQFCGGDKKRHRGHDIGVVGEKNAGMGTVINAIVRSQITLIGKTGEDIGEFGKLDKRSGTTTRTGKTYPRQILAPGYGIVYPFSSNYGRWHSGMVIVTRVLDGPLKDYTVRYMHMGAIRPDLKVGDIVEPGEHIALMGGTAVMDSPPHVHIDAETPTGLRVDLGPYIGIPPSPIKCRGTVSNPAPPRKSKSSKKSGSTKKSGSSKKSGSAKKTSSSGKSSGTIKKRTRASYMQRTEQESAQTRTLARN